MYSFKSDCLKAFIGAKRLGNCYNTRIVNIYFCNGKVLTGNYFYNGNLNTSTFYRIEDIDNGCIKLLLLRPYNGAFYSTHEYITISLNCIGALKCIQDVYVSNL